MNNFNMMIDLAKNTTKTHYNISINIPIEESNRLKTTNGYMEFKATTKGKKVVYTPIKIVVASFLTEEEKFDTLLHEVAHYITMILNPFKNENHSNKWLDIFKTLGGSGEIYGVETAKPKYILECPHCKEQYNYFRMCKAVKNPSNYICSKCHKELNRVK